MKSMTSASSTVPHGAVSPGSSHAETVVVVVDVVLVVLVEVVLVDVVLVEVVDVVVVLVVVADTVALPASNPVLVTEIVMSPALVAVTEIVTEPLASVVPVAFAPAPLAVTVAPSTTSAEEVFVTVTVRLVGVSTATDSGDTATVMACPAGIVVVVDVVLVEVVDVVLVEVVLVVVDVVVLVVVVPVAATVIYTIALSVHPDFTAYAAYVPSNGLDTV